MQPAQVKNRAPAAIQITAEQLLREARERQIEEEVSTAQRSALLKQQQINDPEELAMFQATKRKQFEEKLRHTLHNVSNYLNYAAWEASQLEFRRARSIYERAIDVDYRDYQIWLKYAEFEMKHKFVNHARNVWNRAVTLLPRVSQLWYKYVHMEEMLGQIDNARIIFERWMKWEPEEQAWYSYINFEERVGEIGRARDIYERYCATYPVSSSYVKYAKWEERHSQLALARQIYERALTELPEHNREESIFIAFAKFEEKCHEFERARMIYKQSIDLLPKHETRNLYREFVSFEKKHGSKGGIDAVVLSKRRLEYEKRLEDDPRDYDTWFEYVRLEESEAIAEAQALVRQMQEENTMDSDRKLLMETINKGREQVRDVYERAVAQLPLVEQKKYWKRYIYLWVYYALFEELVVEDVQRSRDVYKTALKVVPHKKFTFSKLWSMAAELEIRNNELVAARKIYGNAIGLCPKPKLFENYIRMEKLLGNTDRCRMLYQKYLEYNPQDCDTWIKFANMEKQVREYDRVRALYELGVSQQELSMPEVIWKKYIDFEIFIGKKNKGDFAKAENLYERLLDITKHVKVWISFGKFLCLTVGGEKISEGRKLFKRAYDYFKSQPNAGKEERVVLLDAWEEIENEMIRKGVAKADNKELQSVVNMKPKKLKKRRELPDGGGWEEYFDYVFPDEAKATKGLKLLEMAQKWKRSGGIMNALKAAKKAKENDQVEEKAKVETDSNELDIDDL